MATRNEHGSDNRGAISRLLKKRDGMAATPPVYDPLVEEILGPPLDRQPVTEEEEEVSTEDLFEGLL